MAVLTKARELALFQILEIPYSRSHKIVSEDGLSITDKTMSAAMAAYDAVTAYLTASVYTSADLQTALEALLDSWISLGTQSEKIEGGSIGSLGGISYNPADERTEIARRVVIIVPFYKFHNQLARSSSNQVWLLR